jgi:hypothetical protein
MCKGAACCRKSCQEYKRAHTTNIPSAVTTAKQLTADDPYVDSTFQIPSKQTIAQG